MAGWINHRGVGAVIFPAERLGELLAVAAGCGLLAMRLRMVHPAVNAPAHRVMVAFARLADHGARLPMGTLVEAPLFVHQPGERCHTDEVKAMLAPDTPGLRAP